MNKIEGTVRGLGDRYVGGGLERVEIHVTKSQGGGLPAMDGERVAVVLFVGGQSYQAGIRRTQDCEYVWICPDLVNTEGRKARLAQVLDRVGIRKNQRVMLEVAGKAITVTAE